MHLKILTFFLPGALACKDECSVKGRISLQWRWTLQKVSKLTLHLLYSPEKERSEKQIEIWLSIVIYDDISKFLIILCRQYNDDARLIFYPLPFKKEWRCFYCVPYICEHQLHFLIWGKKGVENSYGVPALMATTNERVSHSEGVRP